MYEEARLSANKNMNTSQKAKDMARVRWGDKLSCRLVDRDGIRVAQCKWNGVEVEGRGKDNISALKVAFKKINELGIKQK